MLAHSPRIKWMSYQGPEKPNRAASRRVSTYLFCLLLLVLTTAHGFAQSQIEAPAQQGAVGALHGTVTDPAGSVVANATIAVKNQSTGKVIKTVTDQDGHFSVTALSAGKYGIEVSAPGFAVTDRTV